MSFYSPWFFRQDFFDFVFFRYRHESTVCHLFSSLTIIKQYCAVCISDWPVFCCSLWVLSQNLQPAVQMPNSCRRTTRSERQWGPPELAAPRPSVPVSVPHTWPQPRLWVSSFPLSSHPPDSSARAQPERKQLTP